MDSLTFHISNKDTKKFILGRDLAKKIYFSAWGTEDMSNDYDIGIVALLNGEAVGNMNIQLKSNRENLSSECYFFQDRWQKKYNIKSNEIAEICGLAISNKINNEDRFSVLGGLIACSHFIANENNVSTYVTVQRKSLINKLKIGYQYPFNIVEDVNLKLSNIPNDRYWKDNELPGLYSVNIRENNTITATFNILSKLSNNIINFTNEYTNDFISISKVA